MLDLKLLTDYQPKYDQRKFTKANRKDLDGGALDIHNAIEKLPQEDGPYQRINTPGPTMI